MGSEIYKSENYKIPLLKSAMAFAAAMLLSYVLYDEGFTTEPDLCIWLIVFGLVGYCMYAMAYQICHITIYDDRFEAFSLLKNRRVVFFFSEKLTWTETEEHEKSELYQELCVRNGNRKLFISSKVVMDYWEIKKRIRRKSARGKSKNGSHYFTIFASLVAITGISALLYLLFFNSVAVDPGLIILSIVGTLWGLFFAVTGIYTRNKNHQQEKEAGN